MDIKQKFNEIKEKIQKQDFKKIIGTKAFITVGCVMMVCVAVLVSTMVNGRDMVQTDSEDRVLGNTLLVDTNTPLEDADATPENGEDFFAMAILNRTQVRDNALDVLREIADNPDTLPDAKEEALSSISAIAEEMSAEANIETLIEAKGISKCVAVISGDNCSVIVNTEGLIADELTQITDIVYEQTGIPIANITVVEATK